MIRVYKLRKLFDWVTQFESADGFFKLYFSFCRVLSLVLLAVHFLACVWYIIGSSSWDGWVLKDDYASQADGWMLYVLSAHWAMAQIQGEPLISPGNYEEIVLSLVVLVAASVLCAYFVGTVTNTLLAIEAMHSEKTARQRALRQFLKNNNVSQKLAIRMRHVLRRSVHSKLKTADEEAMLAELPPDVLTQLDAELRTPLLSKNPFFRELAAQFPRILVRLCHEACDTSTLLGMEIVFHSGDLARATYFVARGRMEYIQLQSQLDSEFRTVADSGVEESPQRSAVEPQGSLWQAGGAGLLRADPRPVLPDMWISEATLWSAWIHRGDFYCKSDSQVVALKADNFVLIVSEHPSARFTGAEYAKKFKQYMQQFSIDHRYSDLLREGCLNKVKSDWANMLGQLEKNMIRESRATLSRNSLMA